MKQLKRLNQGSIGQIIRFGVVGAITFAINFAVFSIYYGYLLHDYKVAASVAYIFTVLCHFALNKYFTFGGGMNSLFANLPRYGLMLVLNYAITIAASWTTVEVLRLSPYFGVIASTGGTAVSSFIVMKYFVFGNAPIRQAAE